jgi:hypothetical protein
MTEDRNRVDTGTRDTQPPIRIDLASKAGLRLGPTDSLELDVTITNICGEPIWMVGVLPGSEGLRYPHYTAEIEGPSGTVRSRFPEALDYLPAPRAGQFVQLGPGESFDPQGTGFVPIQHLAWFQPTEAGAYRFRLCLDTEAPDLRDWLGHTPVREPERVEALIRQVPRLKVWSNMLVITFSPGTGNR